MHSVFQTIAVAMALFAATSQAAPLESRQACPGKLDAIINYSEGGGGPGQSPIDQYTGGINIYSNGNLVYAGNEALYNGLSFSETIPASAWGGANPIQFQSSWEPVGTMFSSCSATLPGDNVATGSVSQSISSGIVSTTTTTCEIIFNC